MKKSSAHTAEAENTGTKDSLGVSNNIYNPKTTTFRQESS
jgi:hypothetical protein